MKLLIHNITEEIKMAEEKQSAKSAFVEKLLFAILPLIIAGVGYLLEIGRAHV